MLLLYSVVSGGCGGCQYHRKLSQTGRVSLCRWSNGHAAALLYTAETLLRFIAAVRVSVCADPEVKDERSPQSSYAISSAQDFISEAEDADQHGERQRDPRQGGHDKPNTQGLAYLRRGMGTSAPDCETEEKETQGAAEIGAVSPEDEKMC